MSEENVRVVREIYEAINRGDRAAVLSRADPAIRCYDPPARPDPFVYEGHEGLARFMDTGREVFGQVSYVPRDFIEAGPHVVVPITQSGRGRHSAARVDERIVNVWRLRADAASSFACTPRLARLSRPSGAASQEPRAIPARSRCSRPGRRSPRI